MIGVKPMEQRIEVANNRAEDYTQVLVNLKNTLDLLHDRYLNVYEKYVDVLSKVNEQKSRVGELSLLKDVRDGKLLVLDLETREPARIAFL